MNMFFFILFCVGILALVADVVLLVCGIVRVIRRSLQNVASVISASAQGMVVQEEICPTCLKKLVDGECPDGHTIVRCSKCNTIMKDGLCPRCGVQGEVEFCPTCNSELVDGECPRGHTIVRCPDCGAILVEGVCPRGCNSDPLNLGWPGGMQRIYSNYALKVVAPEKYNGFMLRVPTSFIVGRSAAEAKEAFVELLTTSKKEKAQCSRQYIRMDMEEEGVFRVTLLNSSRNPADVNGERLVLLNSSTIVRAGGIIKVNPGYQLEIVEVKDSEVLPAANSDSSPANNLQDLGGTSVSVDLSQQKTIETI